MFLCLWTEIHQALSQFYLLAELFNGKRQVKYFVNRVYNFVNFTSTLQHLVVIKKTTYVIFQLVTCRHLNTRQVHYWSGHNVSGWQKAHFWFCKISLDLFIDKEKNCSRIKWSRLTNEKCITIQKLDKTGVRKVECSDFGGLVCGG